MIYIVGGMTCDTTASTLVGRSWFDENRVINDAEVCRAKSGRYFVVYSWTTKGRVRSECAWIGNERELVSYVQDRGTCEVIDTSLLALFPDGAGAYAASSAAGSVASLRSA